MNIAKLDALWDDVHYFYDRSSQTMTIGDALMSTGTPNAQLLTHNSFFETLNRKPEKVYLLHVTKEIQTIKRTRTLYPSAGCLVGCIYTTQVFEQTDGSFAMHNLGQHILDKEASLNGSSATPLIIEATYNDRGREQALAGIDYLSLGMIHYTIYDDLRYLLTPDERLQLEQTVSHKVKRSLTFIDTCLAIQNGRSAISGRDFIRQLVRTVPKLPILGYIYFESIARLTMLTSSDNRTKELNARGEFNNEIYKSFLMDIYERIGKFKLSDFTISLPELERKLHDLTSNGELTIETEGFLEAIKKTVASLVVKTFLTEPVLTPDWTKVAWDYRGFSQVLAPLLGHMIHRELRNFNRYKDFYFYFDQFKALSAWNYWNRKNISLPFNGPIQKGEIGINPAYSEASYRIFIARKDARHPERLVLRNELSDVEIVPRLVDLRHTAMRSQDHIVRQPKLELQ